jgi:hypothetical protein
MASRGGAEICGAQAGLGSQRGCRQRSSTATPRLAPSTRAPPTSSSRPSPSTSRAATSDRLSSLSSSTQLFYKLARSDVGAAGTVWGKIKGRVACCITSTSRGALRRRQKLTRHEPPILQTPCFARAPATPTLLPLFILHSLTNHHLGHKAPGVFCVNVVSFWPALHLLGCLALRGAQQGRAVLTLSLGALVRSQLHNPSLEDPLRAVPASPRERPSRSNTARQDV